VKTSPPIFVVSAPSGTGKTTLNRRLIAEHPTQVEMSVSYTTRPRRQGEVEGIHYHYVTADQFRDQIKAGEMLEHAEVFGTLYGTSVAEVKRIQAMGKICLLEIDIQGWRQARQKLPAAKSVFILPPSVEALWSRLEARGTESLAVRWRRFRTARDEIAVGDVYDSFIINETVERAYTELQEIVIKGKTGSTASAEGRRHCQRLLAEFDQAPWIRKLSEQFTDKT
jgi:guanylate kinase